MRLADPPDGDDVVQRLLFYLGCFCVAGVVLLGIQAVFVPRGRTTHDFTVIAVLAGIALVFGVIRRVRTLRHKRAAARPDTPNQ